jgi:acetyl/propionyl-CoA carboxylase alpha subunit
VLERARFAEGPGVRVDTGVRSGDTVSTRYDSLLAKVIAHAEDRAACVRRVERALAETVLLGLPTNVGFLHALVRSEPFRRGETAIDFLTRHGAALAHDPPLSRAELVAAALFEALRGSLAPAGGAARGDGSAPAARDPWDIVRDFRSGR